MIQTATVEPEAQMTCRRRSQAVYLEKDRAHVTAQTVIMELEAQVSQRRQLKLLHPCMSQCFRSKMMVAKTTTATRTVTRPRSTRSRAGST